MISDQLPADRTRFQALLDAGREHVYAERLGDALVFFEDAEAIARELGDPSGADRAWLNRCAVLIAMQRAEDLDLQVLHRLRQILMAGNEPANCWLAAYNMAQAYELTKDYRKGTFYAQIARDRAQVNDCPEWLASSYNQLGNLLLAESRFSEAYDAYRQALGLLPEEAEDTPSLRRAAIHDNLGYACIVLDRQREGFRLLYSSLRMLRSLGNQREQVFPRLSLCFAHLEADRPKDALRHGVCALALAEQAEEPVSIKYALFLLGEATQLLGDVELARKHFSRLQARFFPENEDLPDLLLSVNVRKIVNLKA